MGVLKLFSTFFGHTISNNAIIKDYIGQIKQITHFMIDFNSIIHNTSSDIFTKLCCLLSYIIYINKFSNDPTILDKLKKTFDDYEIYIKTITTELEIKLDEYDNHDEKNIDKFINNFTHSKINQLIITHVKNKVKEIINKYIDTTNLKVLYISADGVPTKAKMMEQIQRRYFGSILVEIKKKICKDFIDHNKISDFDKCFWSHRYKFEWSRNNISPGTAFMNTVDNIMKTVGDELKLNCQYIYSGTNQYGEGEKKIMNYIVNNHDINKSIKSKYAIYSPDSDVILLSMITHDRDICILRHNNNQNCHDLIDISQLKHNLYSHIVYDLNPGMKLNIKNLINDIVCLITLFGNDFIPKIPSINIELDFDNIINIYKYVLTKCYPGYLTYTLNNVHKINMQFLYSIMKGLTLFEADNVYNNFFRHNYQNYGRLLNVFSAEYWNIMQHMKEFQKAYNLLCRDLTEKKDNIDSIPITNDFVYKLYKMVQGCKLPRLDEIKTLPIHEKRVLLIKKIMEYYEKNKCFPPLLSLVTIKPSITQSCHLKKLLHIENNDLCKEIYKMENMLDEYYDMWNGGPINIVKVNLETGELQDLKTAYQQFGDKLKQRNNNKYTIDEISEKYFYALFWVFDYYFNNKSYNISEWTYDGIGAPLITHLFTYLQTSYVYNLDYLFHNKQMKIQKEFAKTSLSKTFFTPLEHLRYITPLVEDNLKIFPEESIKDICEHAKKNKQYADIIKISEHVYQAIKNGTKQVMILTEGQSFLNKSIILAD